MQVLLRNGIDLQANGQLKLRKEQIFDRRTTFMQVLLH